MKAKDQILPFTISGLAAYFTGGFFAGMFWCIDCEGIWGNLLGRPFIGLITNINSIINFGFPWSDEADAGPRDNAWPFIIACWVIYFIVYILIKQRKKRITSVSSGLEHGSGS